MFNTSSRYFSPNLGWAAAIPEGGLELAVGTSVLVRPVFGRHSNPRSLLTRYVSRVTAWYLSSSHPACNLVQHCHPQGYPQILYLLVLFSPSQT